MCLSTKADIFSVGLLLLLTMGLPVIFSLCIFSRKYQAGVVQSVGTGNLKIFFVISSLCKAFNSMLWIWSCFVNVVWCRIIVKFDIKVCIRKLSDAFFYIVIS